ncbi:hypothetical protein [Paenibacillus sp. 1P03SA]|uniref:hypothetical protein n=1 Tax=Paenibacillus sp. 1P03SA TaxID=3132294 RepID=UPI0039A1CF26
MTIAVGKMISDVALITATGLQNQLNEALSKGDLVKAKIFKKQLTKALKDYYGI